MSIDWNPQVVNHYIDRTNCRSINIKVPYLPLTHEEETAAFNIIGNEILSQILWMDLNLAIDICLEDHGLRCYVGGRSSGWLYYVSSSPSFDKELVELAQNMLSTLKEHIGQHMDLNHMHFACDLGHDIVFMFYHTVAHMKHDGKILSSIQYEDIPTTSEGVEDLQRSAMAEYIGSL